MSEEETKKQHLILKCPLCKDRGLHVVGEKGSEVRQCISCGYVSSPQFELKKNQKLEDNSEFMKLTEDMKEWAKTDGKRFWIPVMMTLPFAMLYPKNVKISEDKTSMVWCIAYMEAIPKEEQEKYPVPGYEDAFYNKKYNTDDAIEYDSFLLAMSELNEISKTIAEVKEYKKNKKVEDGEKEEK